MGCGSSKQASLTDLAPDIHGSSGPEPALNSDELIRGLTEVAQQLNRQRLQANIVVVGGAVSTIYLRSRKTTHDVDILDDGLNTRTKQALSEAAKNARKSNPNFPSDWLNNKTVVWVQPNIRQQLVDDARAQNVVVFKAPGLTAYAAPWRYAFVSKIDRLSGMSGNTAKSEGQRKDAADGARYLEQVISNERLRSVTPDDIKSWQATYGLKTRGNFDGAIDAVNDAYQENFGSRPISTSGNRSRNPSATPSARSAKSARSARSATRSSNAEGSGNRSRSRDQRQYGGGQSLRP